MLDFKNIIDISLPAHGYHESGQSTACAYFGLEGRNDELFIEPGQRIEDVESRRDLATTKLSSHMGIAMVIDAKPGNKQELDAQVLIEAVHPWMEQLFNRGAIDPPLPERILIKTDSKDANLPLSADAVLFLASKGVKLVGVESSTIGGTNREANPVELLLKKQNIVWLTGLDLSKTKVLYPYFLSAIPLIADCKGGDVPTRAVLLTFQED